MRLRQQKTFNKTSKTNSILKYKQVQSGEWIEPITKGFRLACCECSLVHNMDVRIKNGQVQWRMSRNNRATGQVRRYKKVNENI